MPHSTYTRHLGRNKGWRKATVRSLAESLLQHERITTTLSRAKETQRLAERLITLGKEGSLSARRRAVGFLSDSDLVRRLFSEVAPRFSNRPGGYTRILHAGRRCGDGASMAVLELVELSPKERERVQEKAKETRKEGRGKPPMATGEKPQRKPEHEVPPRQEEKKPGESPPRPKEAPPAGGTFLDRSLKGEAPRSRGFLEGLRKIFKKERNKP